MVLGFIGAGHIATAQITGLCSATEPPERILVSDIDMEKAAALSSRFVQVEAMDNNQDVIDGSDCLFICVLPQIATEVLSNLRFKPDHLVISVVAIHLLEEIRKLVSPARRVVRAVPLPSVARHIGPVAFYPDVPQAHALFKKMGTPVPAQSEKEFIVLSGFTAFIASFFEMLQVLGGRAAEVGVPNETSLKYLCAMFMAQSQLAFESDLSFSALVSQAATPGGLNEQAVKEIDRAGVFKAFGEAMDSILHRLGALSNK